MTGYAQAYAAYLCATYGHVFSWNDSSTGNTVAPIGTQCRRCGQVNRPSPSSP